jgi:hypothetical protein
MDDTTQLIVLTALRKMMMQGWVSICDIDKCLKLAGITPIGPAYNQLHALHCVSFKDMPVELARQVPGLIADVFDGLAVAFDASIGRDVSRALTVAQQSMHEEQPQHDPPVNRSFLRRIGLVR